MHRRHLLKGVATIPLLSTLRTPAALAAIASSGVRRVRPGEPGWPSPDLWSGLSQAVGGALIKPRALVADCETAPDGPACAAAVGNLRNPYFIGDNVSGTQVSGWLNAWSPASSAYAVAARSAADVVAAVNFARKHSLRLAVKGGGHSYQGTSNVGNSLLIWTRAMREINVHEHFVADGCKGQQAPTPAVSVGSGAMWMDVYDAVTTGAGRYVQGGGCTTVGVAGLVQSGGFGSHSKLFGSAAASLLQAEVVTADGAIRVANPCKHPDLFFAIRGGGGGSFGVVTNLTLRTHELPETFGAVGATIKAASDAAFRRLAGRFVDLYAERLFNSHWGESVRFREDNTLDISLVSASLRKEQHAEIWQPFFDWVGASPQDYSYKEEPYNGSTAARGWWDVEARRKRGSTAMISDTRPGVASHHAWWSGDQEQVGAFIHGYDSLWLPAALLGASQRERLVDALVAASRFMEVGLHFNKGLAGAPADALSAARETATNPDVLGAFALALIATGGAPRYPGLPSQTFDAAEARKNATNVDLATAELRRIAPAGGSYVSESNFFNRSWREAFWGSHYPRLRSIKAKYDPDGLFIVHHGVGSEDWSDDGFVRSAHPQ